MYSKLVGSVSKLPRVRLHLSKLHLKGGPGPLTHLGNKPTLSNKFLNERPSSVLLSSAQSTTPRRTASSFSLPFIQVRFYARRTTRTTTTEEERATETRQTELQEATRSQVWGRGSENDDEETTEGTITDGVRSHLTKVYGTILAGVGTSIAGAGLGFVVPGLSIVGLIGGFVGVIALAFMDPSNVSKRQNIFLGVTALMGLGIAPLLMASSLGTVVAATVGTGGIFGGFTLAALKSKRKSMLQLGGVLMGGLFVLVGVSLAGLLLPLLGVTNPALLAALHSFNLYAGLGIFSLFVAYDTQRMIEDYHAGNRDHVGPALSMFLNIFNIFIRLLQIFRGD